MRLAKEVVFHNGLLKRQLFSETSAPPHMETFCSNTVTVTLHMLLCCLDWTSMLHIVVDVDDTALIQSSPP